MRNCLSIGDWGNALGALPLPLVGTIDDTRYALQNGMGFDTCVQINGEVEQTDGFSLSWSSGMLSYMLASEEKVDVYNWYQQSVRSFSRSRVENDFGAFCQYVKRDSVVNDSMVQSFILEKFYQMRNLTHKDEDSLHAMKLLYILMLSLKDDNYIGAAERLGIHEVNIPTYFDHFVEEARRGVLGIRPNLDLILRHCSGTIFEVAHKEVALFNPEIDLFGGISSKIKMNKASYTSMHYTPTYLARSIVDNVLRNMDLTSYRELRILDPACGSGVFLVEILKQLKMKQYAGRIVIRAFDKSDIAIQTVKFLLNYERETQWSGFDVDLDIRLVDSLSVDWGENDIIVMNPPFLSWDLMSMDDERSSVRTVLSEVIDGKKPNMAAAFVYKAINTLAPNGCLGTVVPSSILTVDYYSPIREQLLAEYEILYVGTLGGYVFESALADTGYIVAKKVLREGAIPLNIWCRNTKDAAPEALAALRRMQESNIPKVSTDTYSIYKPHKFPLFADGWRIISSAEEQFYSGLITRIQDSSLIPLKEVFEVFQGVLTGAKDLFELSMMEYNLLPDSEKIYFRPLINHDSFEENAIYTQSYLWYPYNKNGLMINSEEEALGVSFCRDRLVRHKEKLMERKSVENWWELTRPRPKLFKTEVRLLSARFGANKQFAIDLKGDGVIQDGNAYVPKYSEKKDDLYAYLAIFASPVFSTLLSVYAKRIMSGYDLSPKQIKEIPIPALYRYRDLSAYEMLSKKGKEISMQGFVDYGELNQIVSSFYPNFK